MSSAASSTESDNGAGVFGGESAPRTTEPHRKGSVVLSHLLPYASRQDLLESRPGELPPEFAEAVQRIVQEEKAFEGGEFIPYTSFPSRYTTREGDPKEDHSLRLAGAMEKLSSGKKGRPRWQRRWCELVCNRLYYYKDREQGFFSGAIPLDEIVEIALVAKASEEEFLAQKPALQEKEGEGEEEERAGGSASSSHHQHQHKHGGLREKFTKLIHRHHEPPPESEIDAAQEVLEHYEIALRSGRSHGRVFRFRTTTYDDRDKWLDVMWRSKLSFHAFEMRQTKTVMDRLVVMSCLKDSTDSRSFLFDMDNTLVEDLIAHYGMALSIFFELFVRERIEVKNGRIKMLSDDYTGVGLLDEAIDSAHWSIATGRDKLSNYLSKLSGIAEVKKASLWEKAKSALDYRWPGGSFVRQPKQQEGLRLPQNDKYAVSDTWNRAIVVAAQHRLLHYEKFESSTGAQMPSRWKVSDRDFENKQIILLRTLMAGNFVPEEERDVCFAAVAVAMLDVRRREILDYSKVFAPSDGDQRQVIAALKKRLEHFFSSTRPSHASDVESAALKQTLISIYNLLEFSKSRSATSEEQPVSRQSTARRYSIATDRPSL